MWAATEVDGTPIAVSVNMISDLYSRQALDRHMRYAALATLAAVVPLTLLAAELVVRRLRQVAGTARRIRHGDLDARTTGRGHDEISEISSAVNHMADALQGRLHTEQRFTADVAHELRTPLAGLVTSATLLPESEATDLVRDRVKVLHALVDDLLEISRLDAGAERAELQPVPLDELVEESVRRTGLAPGSPPPVTRSSRPTPAASTASSPTWSSTHMSTAARRSRSRSRTPPSPSVTTAPASLRSCSPKARSDSAPAPPNAATDTAWA